MPDNMSDAELLVGAFSSRETRMERLKEILREFDANEVMAAVREATSELFPGGEIVRRGEGKSALWENIVLMMLQSHNHSTDPLTGQNATRLAEVANVLSDAYSAHFD
jgi:hypothetical protein